MSKTPYEILELSEDLNDEGSVLLHCNTLLQKYNPENYDDPNVREVMQEKYDQILDATQIVVARFGLTRRSDGTYARLEVQQEAEADKKPKVRKLSESELEALKEKYGQKDRSIFIRIILAPLIPILAVIEFLLTITAGLIIALSTWIIGLLVIIAILGLLVDENMIVEVLICVGILVALKYVVIFFPVGVSFAKEWAKIIVLNK